jgi:hypothetical protein
VSSAFKPLSYENLPREASLFVPVLVVAFLSQSASAAGCTTAADCEYLGECSAGVCECLDGFVGATCSRFDVAPSFERLWPKTPPAPPIPVPSPTPPASNDFNASGWGASIVYDKADGLWHMLVVSACGAKGVLASGGAGSFISHAVSSYPDRGFELKAQFSPTTSFGPHLSFDPVEKKFVVIFRVNSLEQKPYCVGNSSGTDPLPVDSSFVTAPYIKGDSRT